MSPPESAGRRIPFWAAAVACGAAIGLGGFTFHYADGTSYLSSKSESCANCHVMQGHYDAWVKSSHGRFAVCNDCHAPDDFVGKWYCKSRNGFFHSLAFTTQRFDEPIRIVDYNRGVVEANCRRCHADFVHPIDLATPIDRAHPVDPGSTSISETGDREDFSADVTDSETVGCIRCHGGVGHPVR